MDKNIIKGKWHQIKGDVKRRWGKLTDDDLKQIEGNLEVAAGRIQERYGYSKDQAEREWKDYLAKSSGPDSERAASQE